MSEKLMPDTKAPALSLPMLGGGTWTLADRTPDTFTMVVVYRGVHCPVCKTYLGKLNPLMNDAKGYGLDVIAVSMDTEEKAQKAKDEWDIDNIPIAYGMSKQDVKNWGLYLSSSIKDGEPSEFAEPGLFWVKPDGTLYLIDISNMPFSRPDLEILLPKAKMATENNYPARGTAAA